MHLYIYIKSGNNKNGDVKMKKYTIIAIIIIGIILGFFTGVYLYKINKLNDEGKVQIAETIEDECTALGELTNQEIEDLVATSSKEEKSSPNCVITLKIYYEKCNHIIESKQKIENTEINLTEEELKDRFSDWEIQKFTPTEIVLYKEVDEFCNEHYLLKEEDGYIAIYKLDENNNETLYEVTEIPTQYLPEEDLEKIQNGMKIYTEKELNKTLEDFE